VSVGKAVFVATDPVKRSLLVAASADSGTHAGNLVKETVTSLGGRGGGNQSLAQGSVPTPESFAELVNRIGKLLP
jgi:alanyl-tRNA synthetase